MSIESHLTKLCQDYAGRLGTDFALSRAKQFEARWFGSLQCPYCWMDRGARATLREVRHDNDKVHERFDLYRCNECERTIEHPFRQ